MGTDVATGEPTQEELILASAFFHAPPRRGDRDHANCFRVLRQALTAAGLWEENMIAAFHGEDDSSAGFRVVDAWYRALIEMTRQEPESERLLEGGGNLGDPKSGSEPAGAYFTACWLTPAGCVVAERVLAERPGLESLLNHGAGDGNR